ncbi:hypothetical protein PSTG_04427 [Puccinia striiformis f. sp. tritici PST-78]|uniref:BZIP domain-containing protein n=1 Tax=Puccinia striiformis f. sp. tritici PST-78 TaxID=1165861 RepID=A0A0L0VTD3_9BASI|nr:hypothetical protein PSTG_04427 [Puccinia striiformis f. sp. tritici PST-78]
MKQPPNQLSHLNRPSNPLSQLGLQQQQGNLSLGFTQPPPFGQQQNPVEDGSTLYRKDPGTDNSQLNPHQLSGVYGHHWGFGPSAPPQAENSYHSTNQLEYPEQSRRGATSDVPANQPDSALDYGSHPDPGHFEAQLDAGLPNANQGGSSLPGHAPQGGQFSSLPSSRDKTRQLGPDQQRQVELSQPQLSQGANSDTLYSDHHAHRREIEDRATNSSHGDVNGTCSLKQHPEQLNSAPGKRKITDRRREQNRAHQRAFRERRDLSVRQKDREISVLEQRLNQYEATGREQRETIRNLQDRLNSVGNLQSTDNSTSLPDYSQGQTYGNSLHLNHQSLPPVENLQLEGNPHFQPSIPIAHQQLGSSSLLWDSSLPAYIPDPSFYNNNPAQGSSKNYISHHNHPGSSHR